MNNDIINITMYGGKSIFGGRETKLNVDILRCDKTDECSFYKKGLCLNNNRAAKGCRFAKIERKEGYTSRSKNCFSWKSKWTNHEKYSILNTAKTMGLIGDVVALPYSFMNVRYDPLNNKNLVFSDSPSNFTSYIRLRDFIPENIDRIINLRPQAIFGGTISSYQREVVPKFKIHLSEVFPEVYSELISKYPHHSISEDANIGRKALIYSLKDGVVITDHKGYSYVKQGDRLISESYRSSFSPFDGKILKIEIEINKKMKFEVTNRNQVDEDTIYLD